MNRLKMFFDSLQANFLNILGVILIVVIGAGLVYFFSSAVAPRVSARDKLITQDEDAKKALVDARQVSQQSPAELRVQMVNTQATLTAAYGVFLSQSQISQIMDTLYQYAIASRVSITDLRTQPSASATDSTAFNVTTIRLQAQGDPHQLAEFVARIRDISSKALVISNLNMSQVNSTSKLTMDFAVYTAPADVRPAVPTVANPPPVPVPAPVSTVIPTSMPAPVVPTPIRNVPTLTPVLPTPVSPTSIAPYVLYVVRPGDTLSSIARRYGTSVEAIMAANRMFSAEIRIGQQLIIPAH
jgi:LysM repeat protein